MLTWVNSYKSLIQHFSLSVAMTTNQNEKFAYHFYAWWRTTQRKILKTFCQNIHNKTAIKVIFHFSHYKSMETLSCHSNQSAYATAIKNNSFVDDNPMNISAKFQLYRPYIFWGVDFLINVSQIERFWLLWQPIKLRGLDKKYMFVRGPLNKYF